MFPYHPRLMQTLLMETTASLPTPLLWATLPIGAYLIGSFPTAHLLDDKYTRGPIAFKIHSFPATGNAEQEKNLIRWKNIRILTTDLARYAQPMDLPALPRDPTQTVLPKP